MSRIRPCENCKRRRRKCERTSGDTTCARCSRLNLECIFDTRPIDNSRYNTSSSHDSTTSDKVLAEVDGNDELEDLCQYVKTLENELKRLQLDLDQQRQQNSVTTEKQQQQQKSLIRSATSKMGAMLLPKEWNLTFVNGHLRLETGINTLSDLLRYRQLQIEQSKPIRYLSPLSTSTQVQFQLHGETMICRVVFLLTQHEVFSGSLDRLTDNSTYSLWNHRHQKRFDHASITLQSNDFASFSLVSPLPSASSYMDEMSSPSSTCCDATPSKIIIDEVLSGTTSYCPELLVDLLVQQYFYCFNPVMPLIHQPTFMTHYRKRASVDPASSGMMDTYMTPESLPFSSSSSTSTTSFSSSSSSTTNDFISPNDPVTLAICCFMCLTYCKHLPFTSHQKRKYGEYYYTACREQIDDLYDDPSPHRQLEALIAVNLLYKFMAMTLRLRDSRKLATIGFLLSVELTKYATQPDSSFSEVEKELVVRHSVLASITFSMVEFICVKRMDDIVPVKVEFKPLPGETDTEVAMIDLYSRFCDLTLHHNSIVMVQQIRRVTIGEVGRVNLEALVRFEQTCLDWWKGLPQKWRYCEHPYDSNAKYAVEQCNFDQAMMVHSFMLVLNLGVYSSLVNPQNSQDQLSIMIQQRATTVTFTCCELLMTLADRMKVVSPFCGYSCDYLLRVYDSLFSLLTLSRQTDDKANTPRLLNHIGRVLKNMDGVIPMDNQVPIDMELSPEIAPSLASSYTESTANGLDCSINPAVYTRYPLPAHALLFDLVSTTAKDIGMTLDRPL